MEAARVLLLLFQIGRGGQAGAENLSPFLLQGWRRPNIASCRTPLLAFGHHRTLIFITSARSPRLALSGLCPAGHRGSGAPDAGTLPLIIWKSNGA